MESKGKKLLIFVKSMDGGTGTNVLDICRLNNCRIRVCVLEKPSYRKVNDKRFVYLRDKDYYSVRYGITVRHVTDFFRELQWVMGQIRSFSPDVGFGVDVHCNILISLAKLMRRNMKTVLTTHIDLESNIEQRTDSLLKRLLKFTVSRLYNQADHLVFVSQMLASNFIKTFKITNRNVSVIYNGIQAPEGVVRTVPGKSPVLITIARFVEQKNHENLFRAFKLVLRKKQNARLWMMSDGLQKSEIVESARKLGITDKVRFPGWVSNIYPYLEKADIFVFSSKREGFGYVLVEAMSQGLPVVSTDTPYGPREILDNNKYGYLVPMGNYKKFAEAILTLLENRKTYQTYSHASLERSKYFRRDKMLQSYQKLLDKL